MLNEFLNSIVCPYCGSDFSVEHKIEKKDEIFAGYVKCRCSEFPILDGILILKDSFLNKDIIGLIKEGKIDEATAHYLCLENFERVNSLNMIIDLPLPIPAKARLIGEQMLLTLITAREKKRCRELYKDFSNEDISFHKLLGNSFYETYLKYRFSGESLWSLYPFIPLIKEKNEKILDLCCGVGYTSFILRKYVKAKQLCCADIVFKRLYLAKKYFAPKAQFICFDANYPLPFKKGSFTSILMLDAFGYVRSRALMTREIKRILNSNGLILLLHVHNSLVFNLGGGYPISPKDLADLFKSDNLTIKILPERKVLDNFLNQNKLDLFEDYYDEELNSSNALILIATLDKSIFKIYNNVDHDFLRVKNNLIINPIYDIKQKEDKYILKRSLAKYALGDHYPLSEKYLPEVYEINKDFLNGRQVRFHDLEKVNIEKANYLMKKFVIINVPENYM
jgi:SAM-dependent methyltransferase